MAQIVGGRVVRAFVTDFRAQQNRGSDPVAPSEQVLGVARLGSRALAYHVVEILVAKNAGGVTASVTVRGSPGSHFLVA